ncbi:hypothetical protein V1264_011167 [Littorina saxatilis]|uniref:Uncharacterized protein n=1 Tax=Littorina saxatilis TaxID=31220 RepID=A0AAN9GK63_9CAEN
MKVVILLLLFAVALTEGAPKREKRGTQTLPCDVWFWECEDPCLTVTCPFFHECRACHCEAKCELPLEFDWWKRKK